MARRRMFSLDIVDSDQFTDLPPMARLLYYELGSRADDDGFVGNPKKITKFAECTEDDIKILVDRGYIYTFDSGPIVIRHWLANNQLRKDRYHPTYFKNEREMIGVNPNNRTYYFFDDERLPDGLPLVTIDEMRRKKNNEDEENEDEFILEQPKGDNISNNNSDVSPIIKNQFDYLWNKYPKKIGKKDALQYYNDAINEGESFENIRNGLNNYLEYIKESNVQEIFIKNGSNWFKDYSWNNEYTNNEFDIDKVF